MVAAGAGPLASPGRHEKAFRHEAFLYAGQEELVEGALAFVRAGLEADEPVLVVVTEPKIDALRDALGPDAAAVSFADMVSIGANPARIIPAWREFVDAHAGGGRPLRGIGEPLWPDRSDAEVRECHRHESLLNVAFDGAARWWLLCPYDVEALDDDVVAEARRTHPYVHDGASAASAEHTLTAARGVYDPPLPRPVGAVEEVRFHAASLGEVREAVSARADGDGLDPSRGWDLVLAVNEVATNSLRHGGGTGVLRMWREDAALVFEVRDAGRIRDPLAGRVRPAPDGLEGRGLWLANQLCDLVQVHSSEDGTVVRVLMSLDGQG